LGLQANEYQKKTMETAIYPQAGSGSPIELYYLGLGIASEAGEVAGKIKKLIRDGSYDSVAIMHEVGDVLWYAARLCDALGFDLEDVMQVNYAKLTRRKDNNAIAGSGDNR
jgi:NTP pyrophosphatase (non-canonical NTP hydrolase)